MDELGDVTFVPCVSPALRSFLHSRRPPMPTTATILHQDEIPGGPSPAVVHGYSLETVGEMKTDFLQALLSEGTPCVVGVSLKLASSGPRIIRTLALATCNHVFELILHRPPSKAQKRILQTLFSKIPNLTGFEMPYTIILLAYILNCNISGHDLSSVSLSSETPEFCRRTPGTLIKSQVHSASRERINERWERGTPCSGAKSTDTLDPNCTVRAWFTAMYAGVSPLTFVISQLPLLVPQVWFYRSFR
jgi:hypothetical protein